jgi:glycosyltransferase involved in cell wall biosynthesis
MKPKLSVVIPVYNAGRYLNRCIDSLLAQTMGECEFIFVNDGSTDDSASVLEQYLAADERIKLIHQSNKGVSMARNAGLAVARGDYIGFVDADDDIAADLYERMYTAATQEDCDVVVSNFVSELGGHQVVTSYPFHRNMVIPEACIRNEVLPFFMRSDSLNTACSKLYRRKIIEDYSIRFPENVALGEDGMFNILYFSRIRSMLYIDYTGYYYRETPGSATRNVAAKDYFLRAVEVYESEVPLCYRSKISPSAINRLKSVKLIHSVLSYVHVYLEPSAHMGYFDKWRYVSRMIKHRRVRAALPVYQKEMKEQLGGYQRLLLFFIRQRSLLGIQMLTAYSRYKNKNNKARGWSHENHDVRA